MREVIFTRESKSGKDQRVVGRAESFAVGTKFRELLFINCAMPMVAAKAAAAMIRGRNDSHVTVHGFGFAGKVEEGYQVVIRRLPKFATCQLIVVARWPRLVFGDVNEAIWRYVTSQAITTPVLPEWREYVVDRLMTMAKVGRPNGFGFPAWLAEFETKDVDSIVEYGLSKRKIRV